MIGIIVSGGLSFLFVLVSTFLGVNYFKSRNIGQNIQEEKNFVRTTQARLEVERAWDVYHDGALGGTLQSPKVQTELEMYLHRSRELLAEAYEAEDKGDFIKTFKAILDVIFDTFLTFF